MRRSAQFSSYVLSVKLVTLTGKIIEISKSQNKDYLPAIRSHYDMLGIVCEVTVRVFKMQPLNISFQVAQIKTFLSDFAAELQTLKDGYDQVFGMLFPITGKLLWQCREPLEPEIPRPPSLGAFLDPIESKNISLFGSLFLPLVKAVTKLHPSAEIATFINSTLVNLPLKIIRHSSYIINLCDRAIPWAQDDPDFEFYDWIFPEEK